MIFIQTQGQPVELTMTGADGENIDRIEPGAMRSIELPAEGETAVLTIKIVPPTPVEETIIGEA
jgi:hypothetical protein